MSQRKPMREHISDKVIELVDMFAAFPAETKSVDSRAWQHLLVYVPKEELEARLKKINERKKEDGN